MAKKLVKRANEGRVIHMGIDPGANGGIVLLGGTGIVGRLQLKKATEHDVWDYLSENASRVTGAHIESISPGFAGSGKSSVAKLYGSYMQLRMALIAAKIPFEKVGTAKWRASHGIEKRKPHETDSVWKNRLKSHALQLYPAEHITLDIADAVLIAAYSRNLYYLNGG